MSADEGGDTRSDLVLRALSSPVRREILWRLWDAELRVAEIAAGFDLSAPTISRHLTVLRKAELVHLRPEGTVRWYRARQDRLEQWRHLLPQDPTKWMTQSDFTEQQRASGVVRPIVVVTARAPVGVEDAFRAFTDGELYSRWLGVPVRLVDGQFTARMEFGTVVRGTYDLVCPPSLIVMNWDFQDGDIPAPGATLRAQLVLEPQGRARCGLHLHQFVTGPEQARYMDRAWRLVLGRFVENARTALDPEAVIEPLADRRRASRPDTSPDPPDDVG